MKEIDKELLLTDEEIKDIVGTKYAELMAGYYQTKTALEWKVIKDKAIAQAQLKKAQAHYEPLIEKARKEGKKEIIEAIKNQIITKRIRRNNTDPTVSYVHLAVRTDLLNALREKLRERY